jgi:Zn finger protein HypA/HybF involved in hydrogenase expression
MTREEAIANLKMIRVAFVDPGTKERRKLVDDTFDMAIQALENHDTFMKYVYSQGKHDALSQEPTVTSTDEPMTMVYPTIVCDDAISREAVYRILKEYHIDEEEIESAMDECQNLTVNSIISDVSLLPSVTHKSGKWIDINGIYAECSNCNEEIYITGDFNYCPNCGAKMVEPQESEEQDAYSN